MTIQVIDVETMKKFSVDGVQPIILKQSKEHVIQLLCLDVGQEVGPCVMTKQVIYLLQSGGAQLSVEREQRKLITGSLVVVSPDTTRTLTALERSCVIAIQVP